MNIGIVGIGLIGGSFAKALSKNGQTVYGFDTDNSVLDYAKMTSVVAKNLDNLSIPDCEMKLSRKSYTQDFGN